MPEAKESAHRAVPRGLFVTLLAVLAVIAIPLPAQAHFLGYDSVDGREIRYDDETQWDDARTNAISAWNAVGSVDMKPDAWNTYPDLDIKDYDRADDQCGYYSNSAGADEAYLNNRYYRGYNTTQRRACAAHEFGHAYGLNHSYASQVMDQCPVCYNPYVYYTPQSHDRSDYRALWG